MHAYEATNDHAGGGPAPPHLTVEDEGVAGGDIFDMVVEHIKDGLLGGLPVGEGEAVVLHPVPLLSQLIVHLPGCLYTFWPCGQHLT